MKKQCGFRFTKRLLSVALAAALVCQLFGLPVLALGASDTVGSSGCTHVHNETCGYLQAEEGTPCKHELGQHDETCGYSEGTEEIPCDLDCEGDDHAEGCAYRPAQEGTPCTHTEHDENCGYAPAVEGAPCNHVHDESCGGLTLGQSDSGETAPVVVAAFDALDPATYEIAVGGELPALPEMLQATGADGEALSIEGVTWECESFNANMLGEYVFTAKLSEGYETAPEIGAPQIAVTVKAAVNKLDFTSFAVGNTVIVDNLNYTILTMPAGNTHGTVEVGNNQSYTGNNLSIPAEITVSGSAQNDGTYDVVGISDRAFFTNTNLTGTLTIPASVTDIGGSAFFGCSGITGLELPANGNLKTIGDSAFFATGISGTLTIPASVTNISGFNGCAGIKEIVFSKSGNLKTIGDSAFRGTGISGKLTIPTSVTDIGGDAFSDCSGITGLELPANGNLKTIGDYAFFVTGISGTLTIPASVTDIGGSAFNNCSGITGLELPANSNLKTIGGSAFSGTGISGTLTIPASVTDIGGSAFEDCSGITGLELPANGNLKTIGKSAFWETGISGTLTIPASVTDIGSYAFYNCSSITRLELPANGNLKTIGDYAFSGTGISGTLTIPAGVASIGKSAFGSCSKITALVLPSSGSLSIGKLAFVETGISGTLTIPAGVASIGEQAFFGCSGITGLELPSRGSLSIGESAFFRTGISGTLTVSSSVKSIGNSAFFQCSGITGLELPSSGSLAIGNSAFSSTGISGTLTIPKGVASISAGAFASCTGITALELSDFTGSIGERAFLDCINLAAITFGQTTAPELQSKVFYNVKEKGTIYYPQGATGYEKLLAGGLAQWQLADFEPHTVTIGTATGGSAEASQYTAQAGTVITVTAQPEVDYDFIKWTVSPSVTWVDGTNETSPVAKFTMPDGNVTVTPEYKKVRYDISGEVTINGNPVTQKVPIKVQKVATPLPTVYTDSSGNYKIAGLGNGIYILTVDDFTVNGIKYSGSGSVQISNGDVTLDIDLKSSAVQKAVQFTGLTANGSTAETTTELTMTFDTPVDLKTDQIAISGTGVTVTKGTLVDSDSKKTWTLQLTSVQITSGGSASIKVELKLPDTYVLTPTEKTVTVYQAPTVTAPGAPTNLQAAPGDEQVVLTWTAPASDGGSAITKYQYKVSPGAGNWTDIPNSATATSYTVTGLTNGTTYTFQVRAVNEKGAGAASNSATATPTAAATAPGAPTNLQATPGDGRVVLTWETPTSDGGSAITKYQYKVSPGNGNWTDIPNSATATSYTVKGLTNGATYTFQVRAVNEKGAGAASNSATATPTAAATAPGAPTNLQAAPGDGRVVLTWETPTSNGGSAITKYQYKMSPGDGNWTDIPNSATATTYTVTGLTNGATYTFQVRAVNGKGAGAASNEVKATPAATAIVTTPGAPTNLQATPGDGRVVLTWETPTSDGGSAITKYQYKMSPGDGNWTDIPNSATATTYTVKGLTNGATYTFQVRAVNEKGAGIASNEKKVTPVAATYTLTVINGTDRTNKGPYIEGTQVSIKAGDAPAGYRFDKWVSLGGGRFKNDQSAETIFIMPGADVKIEAIFIKETDPGHSHTFDSTWSFDENSHWHTCTAGDGARSKQAAHTASNWMIDKPATETEAGSRYKECTVCHYVLQRETIAPTGPNYSLHTLEDRDIGVKVSGYFTNDAVLVVKDRLLHAKNTCDVCDDIRARQDKGELIVLFDLSLSSGSYTGDLDVQIPVDAKYNGQTVLLLHCKEKVLESRTVTVENGVAKGTFSSLSPFAAAVQPSGTTTITGLPGDYTLLVGQNVSWTPAPTGGTWSYDKDLLSMTKDGNTYTFKGLKIGKATATYTVGGVPHTINITINASTLPQTGDTANPLPWLLILLAALVGCTALLVYRKRHYTKRHG